MASGRDRSHKITYLVAASLLVLALFQCFLPFGTDAAHPFVSNRVVRARFPAKEEVSGTTIDVSIPARQERKDCAIEGERTAPRFDPATALEVEVSFVRRVLHRRVAPRSCEDAFIS